MNNVRSLRLSNRLVQVCKLSSVRVCACVCVCVAPSRVQGLEVEPLSSSSLRVSWLPPARLNGNNTVYVVQWRQQPINNDVYELRNYCIDSQSDAQLSVFFIAVH